MIGRSNIFFAVLIAFSTSAVVNPGRCCAQSGIELGTIDVNTRWAFRSISPVKIGSSIIRLGDIVQPLDPNMAGWNRLKGSPIALLPLDGTKMTIQRDRLTKTIHDAEATPQHIDWIGPKAIVVSYQERVTQTPTISPKAVNSQASYLRAPNPPSEVPSLGGTLSGGTLSGVPQSSDAVQTMAYRQLTARGAPVPVIDILNEKEAEKVLRWIKLGIERQLPSVATSYAIDIDTTQASLVSLRAIAGVSSIAMLSPLGEGLQSFRVIARTVNGNVQCDFKGTLSKHPLLVVPKKSLARGHLIHESDLIMKPFSADDVSSNYVRDIELVIGREARTNVRAGQPIRENDIGAPIEVHRGDLVELRVNGGGISVTTNAKALGDGAASDLIEVETMRPRKRIHARVVESGVVEIVTRAPRVR